MSSRILRGESLDSSRLVWERMVWRRTVQPVEVISYRESNAPPGGKPAGGKPADTPGISPQEAENRAAAAYQQGLAAGEQAGVARANARIDPVLNSLNSIISELAGTRQRFRAEAEEATVALAIAIARRVLHRELATDSEAILGLVKAAFQRCDARETHRLILSPADAEMLREHRSSLKLPGSVEIVADAAFERGAAVVQTSRGDLDVSIETQLAEIERGFADVFKRRNG